MIKFGKTRNMNSDYEEWDQIYRKYPLEALPWEFGKHRKILVELLETYIFC